MRRTRGGRTAAAGLALAAWAAAAPAFAWDDAGHQVIAAIAWHQMRPETRARAADLLAAAPAGIGLAEMAPAAGPPDERARRHFLLAATWPDRLRETDRATDTWHWINRFWRDGPGGPVEVPPPFPQPEENLLERLGVLSERLADPARPAAEHAAALAWLLHLVGDAHQPFHTSARITGHPDELRGDRGGNAFELHVDPETGRPLRLHAYWDRLLSNTLPRRPGEPRADWIDRIATDLARRHPSSTLGPLAPGDFTAWIDEGAATARTTAYRHGLARGRRPPEKYRRAAWAAAAPAIVRAGHRLAALLDEVLGISA
ncbi:MAG TPA: S1/P1 nuclease [Thermoanaerobaculia bacterium]